MSTVSTRGRGRPKGSKTRPDAPSKLKKTPPPARTSDGKFISKNPAPPPAQTVSTAPAQTVQPAPAPAPQTISDQDIFGGINIPPENSQPPENPDEPEASADNPPGEEKSTAPEEPPLTAETHRPFASMCFDMFVNAMAMMIGKFWLPRPVGKNVESGEIAYDEKEMVVAALCKYFLFIGMVILNPLQELWLAIAAYCLPRLQETVMWFKAHFMKKAKAGTPPSDSRMPGGNNSAPPKADNVINLETVKPENERPV